MRIYIALLVAAANTFARSLPSPNSFPGRLKPDVDQQIKTEFTCRWSNCGESCPAGFSAVPRKGSKTGEMMWDHTHCGGVGVSTFCCPQDSYLFPACSWQGHRNSGRCQQGCPTGQVDVGTLRLGCKTGHQTACCSSTPAVTAYDLCEWIGSAPLCSIADPRDNSPSHPTCPNARTEWIFSASAGYGGDQPCETGSKSYCCKREIKAWTTNCAWYKKATNLLPPNVCEPSCPAGHIRLAVQKGDCDKGEKAYCCRGLLPAPEPPKKSARVHEFESALEKYIKAYESHECSAADKPDYPDWLQDPTESVASTSQSDLVGISGIIPELPPCVLWSRVSPELDMIIDKPASEWSIDQQQMADTWNSRVAGRWPGTSVADLAAFLEDNPISSSRDVARSVVRDFDMWVGIRQTMNRMRTEICVEVDVGASTQDSGSTKSSYTPAENSTGTLHSRAITLDLGRQTGDYRDFLGSTSEYYIPWLGRIFDGIRLGHLSLHYARWERYLGHRQRDYAPGPMLELAYWIGPEPGIWGPRLDEELELWRYRDLRTRGRGNNCQRDRWVVFHVHFDETREMFWQFDGHTFVGATAITMFHGYRTVIDEDGRGWRVDNSGSRHGRGNTARSVLHCPWNDLEKNLKGSIIARMWIGHLQHPYGANRAPHLDDLPVLEFINRLFRQGYLNTAGILPIIERSWHTVRQNQYHEFAFLQHPIQRDVPVSRAEGDSIWLRPYGTNFRIPSNWHQDFPVQMTQYIHDIDMPAQLPGGYDAPWQWSDHEHPGRASAMSDVEVGNTDEQGLLNGTGSSREALSNGMVEVEV